jgi:protein-S-isoprenylcysteine O-methyltransferase Ste14
MNALRLRDLVERIALVTFVSWLAWRIVDAVLTGETSWVSGFVLVGEVMVLIFVLIGRRASAVSVSPREWLLAFAGTAAPLFVTPGGHAMAPMWLIAALFMVGISLQLAAKLNLNRSFGIVPANRGVVTTGFYGIVRHPVYASYLLGHLAFLLLNPTLWNLAVYVAALGLQIGRMMAEENLLSRDPAYAAYLQTVRYRLVPGLY